MKIASPRRIRRASRLTGPDMATARKVAMTIQLSGLRSRYSR